jgi:hypothetical protein
MAGQWTRYIHKQLIFASTVRTVFQTVLAQTTQRIKRRKCLVIRRYHWISCIIQIALTIEIIQ